MALEKNFLLPPLKGLNLYDNPFTMTPDYAVDLTNFMPPTTTFTVRPAVKRIRTIEGQIRGLYSYSVGAAISFGENFYNSTIKYSAASYLIVKTLDNDTSRCKMTCFDSKNGDTITTYFVDATEYNDDYAMYNHTMFFVTGTIGSACTLLNVDKGMSHFVLVIGNDGNTDVVKEVGYLNNIVIYKKFIFFSNKSELNVYFIEGKYADVLDPANNAFWNATTAIFELQNGKSFSLDGLVQNGGTILKMANISRSGSDTLSTYLVIITNLGEVVMFDGTDPTDTTGEKWKIVGRFQISPPINKECFCDMEGDLIVVTQNGLVSLRKVVFGQATAITENLEFRLMSIFSDYQFYMPAFSQFININYFQKNRLLILNVPTDLPISLKDIPKGYEINKNKTLTFPIKEGGVFSFSPEQLERIEDTLKNYVFKNFIDYSVYIEFDGDVNAFSIYYSTETTITGNNAVTVISLGCINNKVKKSFLENDLRYIKNDFLNPDSPIVLSNVSDAAWSAYSYTFPDKQHIMTNILSSSSYFYTPPEVIDNLSGVFPPRVIKGVQSLNPTDTLYGINVGGLQDINADIVFKGEMYGVTPIDQKVYNFYPDYYLHGNTNRISLYKLVMQGMMFFLGELKNQNWILGGYDFVIDTTTSSNLYTYLLKDSAGAILGSVVLDCNFQITGARTINTYEYRLRVAKTVSISGTSGYIDVYNYVGDIGTDTDASTGIKQSYFKLKQITNVPDTSIINVGNKTLRAEWDGNSKIPVWNAVKIFRTNNVDPEQDAAFDSFWNNAFLNFCTWANSKIPDKHEMTNYGTLSWYFSNVTITATNKEKKTPIRAVNDKAIANVDLSLVEPLNQMQINCDFGSRQYVFDSHFGTWSCFEDINMFKAIEHENEFFFFVPNSVTKTAKGYIVNSCDMCKFDRNQLGDMKDINPDPLKQEYYPIVCGYKTVPTYDLGKAVKKVIKRIKLFGTPSVFWQPSTVERDNAPLYVTPYGDFKEGLTVSFPHWNNDKDTISRKVLTKHFKSRSYHELSFYEQKMFWEHYMAENDMLSQIEVPLILQPSSRFGLEIKLYMTESYMSLYGFEIFYESTQSTI